jgi:hypothetical protein
MAPPHVLVVEDDGPLAENMALLLKPLNVSTAVAGSMPTARPDRAVDSASSCRCWVADPCGGAVTRPARSRPSRLAERAGRAAHG